MITSTGPVGIDTESAGGRAGRDGDRTIVWLWGEHDVTTRPLVSAALAEAIEGSDRDVVVDLTEVPYMGAAIIHPLLRCRALLACRGRRLTVRSAQSCPHRLLEVCDLTALIETAPVAGSVRRNLALTALETWVEVPRAARSGEPTVPGQLDTADVGPQPLSRG